MSTISFRGVQKVFPGGVHAVEDLDLEVGEGELLVLLGPSGCGKTTVLRMLAGLEAPTRGQIFVGERRVDELAAADRDVAMIFQSYALYPHKTVRENLAFPLRMRRTPRTDRDRRVEEVAVLLDLTPLLDKRPAHLSGGQQQRVAIGRALVREPAAFLMDEPLSNLDAQLRTRIRSELGALQRRLGITTLFVTHDQIEAMTLGHRVAVLREGQLQQVGTPDELYRSPANVFVAGFVGQPGMNLLDADVVDDEGTLRPRLAGSEGALPLAWPVTAPPGQAVIGWRPEALRIVGLDDPEAVCRGTVSAVESLGPERLVHVQTSLATASPVMVTLRMHADRPTPTVDERVGLVAAAEATYCFDADGRAVTPARDPSS